MQPSSKARQRSLRFNPWWPSNWSRSMAYCQCIKMNRYFTDVFYGVFFHFFLKCRNAENSMEVVVTNMPWSADNSSQKLGLSSLQFQNVGLTSTPPKLNAVSPHWLCNDNTIEPCSQEALVYRSQNGFLKAIVLHVMPLSFATKASLNTLTLDIHTDFPEIMLIFNNMRICMCVHVQWSFWYVKINLYFGV